MPDKRFQDKVVMIELDKLVHRNNSDQKVLNHLQLVFERELVEMSHNNLDENNDHENIV
jgi:hypothetical protein